MATLTVVGGLPAVGKTAVCREILRLRAEARPQSRPPTWLRIDTIEQALRDSGEMLPGMPGGAGYYVAAAVARDVLASGGEVLVECVNPLPITRRDYAPWPEADLHLDTARLTATEAARAIISAGGVSG